MPDPSPSPEDFSDPALDEVEALLAMLRAHTTATLLCADRATPIRYVIDNATGGLVAPIEGELLDLDDYLLMIPEESFEAMQVHVAPVVIDQRSSESADRHLAYHGVSDPSAWVHFEILSANVEHPLLGHVVADGADLSRPNAIRSVEPRLCKMLNANPAAVAALCKRHSNVDIERPLVVGVDPDGMDVRAKFGIVRIAFHPLRLEPVTAAARLTELLAPRET